jgi:hypothetical protein
MGKAREVLGRRAFPRILGDNDAVSTMRPENATEARRMEALYV